MPRAATLSRYRAVQDVARQVLAELGPTITAADTEASIARRAVEALGRRGITETWYYDCPALVLLGTRSCLSVSGRNYTPALEEVGVTNLVTVDLSPRRYEISGEIWGDCARSFVVENGRHTSQPTFAELAEGRGFLESLHSRMLEFVHAGTTLSELYLWTNEQIRVAGFENLDFAHNVGHSIERRLSDRRFITATDHGRLDALPFFTFEPHVRRIGGPWGFKHEDIFFVGRNGRVQKL